MKRRLALLLATALLGTVGMLVPTSPASATSGPNVCAFTGEMFLSGGLGSPLVTPARLRTFAIGWTIGTCVPDKSFGATGHVHGWCAHFTGSGVTSNGAEFHFISAGSIMITFGHLAGVAHVTDTPTTGNCITTTATSLLVTGAVALTGLLLDLPLLGTLENGCDLPVTWNCL